MFTVKLVNFPVSKNFKTLEEAKNYCVSCSSEAQIYENSNLIMFYAFFGGFTRYGN